MISTSASRRGQDTTHHTSVTLMTCTQGRPRALRNLSQRAIRPSFLAHKELVRADEAEGAHLLPRWAWLRDCAGVSRGRLPGGGGILGAKNSLSCRDGTKAKFDGTGEMSQTRELPTPLLEKSCDLLTVYNSLPAHVGG